METANAFDMLILPMLQWCAGTVATLPVLHGIRVVIGKLFGDSDRAEPTSTVR
jgi:hypothetical protein